MKSLFALKNISLYYRPISYPPKDEKITALKNLTLEIYKNEFLVILGANGSGKSSLAKLLAGLAEDFTGEISYNGNAITDYARDIFSDVALILQEPQNQVLMPTVAAEIAFPLENQQLPQADISDKVREVASKFGLSELLDRGTDSLSGGQITNLVLAAALVTNPKTIILDEPDSHLDDLSKVALMRFISENKGKMTIVLISQYPQSAQNADRCVVFDDGNLSACGQPGEILGDEPLLEKSHLKLAVNIAQTKSRINKKPPNDKESRPVLLAEELTFSYDKKKPVLKNINLDIYKSERIGLIGPSGSGKTTLGLIMAGLLKPQQGRVLLEGSPIESLPTAKLRRLITMAMQFPERALIEETVAADIAFGPRNLEYQNIDTITTKALEQFRIAHLRDRHPFILSGGQKRRAALAGIMAINSSILIFDEPTAGLDPLATNEFTFLLNGLVEKTLIVISHDRDLLMAVCSRLIALENGEIVSNNQESK